MSLLSSQRPVTTPPPPASPARGPVTWRSIALGLFGILLICGLTPYNDYVVNNTFFVGNYLPVGLLLTFVVFSLLINAPLSRWAPRHALSTAEVAVAFAMALVSCSLPSSGLMRYLPANLVSLHHVAGQNADAMDALKKLDLPDWIFPVTGSVDLQSQPAQWTLTHKLGAENRPNDEVVKYFIGRVPVQTDSVVQRFLAVPWAAWLRPALVWGALLACLAGMILCMTLIVRAQWADNERLPFPLAGVFQSLIEQPEPGRNLNPLLSAPLFWIAFFAVFFIHGLNALNGFFPRFVPAFPLGYNFGGIFNTPPLEYTDWFFKTATLYFCVIGLTFFLQSAVSFSIWFFFIALQVVTMITGTYQVQITGGMKADQNFGGIIAFAASILWVGRAHWVLVMRQMLRGQRDREPQARYISYRASGWGLLIFGLGAMIWLVAAGCSVIGAAALVVMLFMFFLVVSRIVAETGIPFLQLVSGPWRLWSMLAPFGIRTTGQSFFYTAWTHGLFIHDMRESATVFTSQAIRVADQAAYSDDAAPRDTAPRRTGPRSAWPLIACLVGALSVGFIVSGVSTLFVEYSYAATLDRRSDSPLNSYAISGQPNGQVLEPTVMYLREGGTGTPDQHSAVGHAAIGAGLTAFLAAMRLRFTAWPFHPVGFLLVYAYPLRLIWFSVFIGWLCKTLVVRFGGIELLRALRPLFLGLIIGEAGAVAFWLVINLICVQLGIDYPRTAILPT